MPETDDITLLKQFAETDSEPAFAGIVSRHLNLVYSTALRATGNAHAAQEISQAVFIILARKAKSLGAKAVLSGWLHRTARLTAANHVRGEIRRQKREQETFMQSTLNETADETWRQIAPVLDEAISKLGAKDRDAIVLRFFENKSLGEVGAALGASEDAAKMRVNRALEKLGNFSRNARHIFGGGDCRGGFSEFSSGRAGGFGENDFRRGDNQRRGGGRFNPGFGQRSIETYGMDKNEDGNCCGRSCIARGGNDNNHRQRNSARS